MKNIITERVSFNTKLKIGFLLPCTEAGLKISVGHGHCPTHS